MDTRPHFAAPIRVLSLLLLALFVLPLAATGDEVDDAEFVMEFAQKRGLDIRAPLEWTYQVSGVQVGGLKPFIDALTKAGFTEIVLPEMDAENDAGIFEVWFSEVGVHTTDSLAERYGDVAELCAAHGAQVESQSVQAIEKEP